MNNPSCCICKGSGLVEKPIIICPKCVGMGCISCKKQSGFIQYPWEECENCIGSGTEPVISKSNDIKVNN